jgi:hypothetical protein
MGLLVKTSDEFRTSRRENGSTIELSLVVRDADWCWSDC